MDKSKKTKRERPDMTSSRGLQPREVGLIAAALALIADQGLKLFLLYGAGFAHMRAGAGGAGLAVF